MIKINYTILDFIVWQIVLFCITFILKNKKIYLLVYIFLFSIWLGKRNFSIGADTLVYISEYIKGTGGYFSEVGFKLLNYFLYKLNITASNYLVILALLNSLLFYCGFNKIKDNKLEFYIIYYIFLFSGTSLFGYINIIRQSLAGGFLLIMIGYLKEKSHFRAMIVFILGLLFHASIILFLPFLFMLFIKIKIKLKPLEQIFILESAAIVGFFSYKVLKYNTKFSDSLEIQTNKIFYLKLFLLLVLYIYCLYYIKCINKSIEFLVFFYCLFLMLVFIQFPLIGGRIMYYTVIFSSVICARIYYRIKHKIVVIFLIQLYHILILFYPSTVKMFRL